jgi:hypothetical protein
LLTEEINVSKRSVEKAKTEVDRKLDQMRQAIHERTAPKAASPASAESEQTNTTPETVASEHSMKERVRELLRSSPFQPFVIRMADGRQFKIEDPEFVLAPGTSVPQVTVEEKNGRQHALSARQITSIERLAPPPTTPSGPENPEASWGYGSV